MFAYIPPMRCFPIAALLLGACAGPNYQQICSSGIAARQRGLVESDSPAQLQQHIEDHLHACAERCDLSKDDDACRERAFLAAQSSTGGGASALVIRDRCAAGDRQSCDWTNAHKDLMEKLVAEREKWLADREVEKAQDIAAAKNGAAKNRNDDRRQPPARPDEPAEDMSKAPIDRVLAKADRELKALGYKVTDTDDRVVAGGEMIFEYSAFMTDRRVQVICAAEERFHGTVRSGSETGEFTRVEVQGAYVERFIADVFNHFVMEFHVIPGWLNTPQRLACRIYKN
jgi:hypothetical protein